MPLLPDLRQRRHELVEQMDKPDADRELLFNTYRHFARINPIVSGWRGIYRDSMRPLMRKAGTVRILDIGFGGGDVIRSLERWTRRDGFSVSFTGIETDERALEFVRRLDWPAHVVFEHSPLNQVAGRGDVFDFVISNAVLHHLADDEVANFGRSARQCCRSKAIFSDIERHPAAVPLFAPLAKVFCPNSYACEDGLTSIRRSFTHIELRQLLGDSWNVFRKIPFRLVAMAEGLNGE